jgi:hypothetical protein
MQQELSLSSIFRHREQEKSRPMVLYMVFSLKSLLLVGPAPQTLLVDSSCSTALGSLLQKKCHMATMRTAKQILSMAAAVGILLMVAYWIYGWITARRLQADLNLIEVSARFDLGKCMPSTIGMNAFQAIQATSSPKHPLAVSIHNKGKRTVTKVAWSFSVYREGYSSDLTIADDTASTVDNIIFFEGNRYESDKILKPGEIYEVCYPLPILRGDNSPDLLKYVINLGAVEFSD